MECAQGGMTAKERYSGDSCVKTKNLGLVIGNTHDRVTLLKSARNVPLGWKRAFSCNERILNRFSLFYNQKSAAC